MQLQQTQTLQQAFANLRHLPTVEQKQVFSLIDSLLLKTKSQKPTNEPSDLQKSFLEWQARHQAMIATLDENDMTDEEFDEIFNNLRDRNDVGREVNFDE